MGVISLALTTFKQFYGRNAVRKLIKNDLLNKFTINNARRFYEVNGHVEMCKTYSSDDKSMEFSKNYDAAELRLFQTDMIVLANFLNEQEETSLLNELEPYMAKLKYQFDHWDDAIHGYRETERLKWNENNTNILKRVKDYAFSNAQTLNLIHILDLAEDGHIKPHVDSVRFCGDTIAGLSLLSDSVMRLVNQSNKEKIVHVLLKRCSLYVMKNSARYDYSHEILPNSKSMFNGVPVVKKRRISVICRNEPE